MAGTPGLAPNGQRAQIAAAAKETAKLAAGKPYLNGGKTTGGFDCSGFVAFVYHQIFPQYAYMDTNAIQKSPLFKEVQTPLAGDLIFFPKGTNPYEVKKGNNKVFDNHVGIVLDANTWIGSQTSTGVAQVPMTNPWWAARARKFLRYTQLAG